MSLSFATKRVGRAELARDGQFRFGHVKRNERVGPGQRRRLHGVEADPARTDHDNTLSRSHVRTVHDRAESGDDAARQKCRTLEWQLVRHSHDLGMMDERKLCEPAREQSAGDGRPVCEPDSPGNVLCERPRADRGEASPACPAVAARADQRNNDAVASDHVLDTGTDRLDDSGGLVAGDERQAAGPIPLAPHDVDVTPADGRRGDPDYDLAVDGVVELDLVDRQRFAIGATDGGPGSKRHQPGPHVAIGLTLCTWASVMPRRRPSRLVVRGAGQPRRRRIRLAAASAEVTAVSV